MPWIEGRIHEAGNVVDLIQRCSRCDTELAGLPAVLGPGMSPTEALQTDWATFSPGAWVQEETSETSIPGVVDTRMKEISGFEAATGAMRMCDDTSHWPPSEEPRD